MIKAIKRMLQKYNDLSKKAEYVNIAQVKNDLYELLMESRLLRIPKKNR